MQLSVIIVNYNVKYFLEQVLHSVYKALNGIEAEVFVVDNNSADGSCEMVKRKFPQVLLIENKTNVGFSAANNQAIKQSTGKYVLLLNPDTVVDENCFSRCITFMESHANAGGLGVKMIDGKGRFLPESKRGLPTPLVAFYKMFGVSALFPKSPLFGKYHLGFLDKEQTHVVDVLAGAFMLIRKETLDKVGLLDEDYFMYGEDIDLSYRITKAGYKNYYFSEATIIHYKGESTKKTSVNYVFVFYKAMIVFAQKHYTNKHAKTFSLLINCAIYLRATISLIARFFQQSHLMLMDAASIYGGIYLIKLYWEQNHKYIEGGSYPTTFMLVNATIYTLLWLLGLYFANAYTKTRSTSAVFKGVIGGLIGISIFYAFSPDQYRYSRAIIMLAFSWAFIGAYLNRLLLYIVAFKKLDISMSFNSNTIIVGNQQEVERVRDLLKKTNANCKIAGYVSVEKNTNQGDEYLGDANRMQEIVQLFAVEEIIFCSKDVSAGQIIQWMGSINAPGLQYKIVPEESSFIIGSNNKNTAGDFYALDVTLALNEPLHLRKKRMLDLAVSLVLLPLTPVLFFMVHHKLNYAKNWLSVLFGKKTWVGYSSNSNNANLPKIKQGVLSPFINNNQNAEAATVAKLNFLYAKNYSIEKDLFIILYSLSKLGN